MLEAIHLAEQIAGRQLHWTLREEARRGDHQWWISHVGEFESDYPDWKLTYDVPAILREIHDDNVDRWTAEVT
jgi:CDP-paratose 2-epimerase